MTKSEAASMPNEQSDLTYEPLDDGQSHDDAMHDDMAHDGISSWSPPPLIEARPHELIRASAGSGKTFALSNRYLALLSGGASPQAILATTFTRKAAGEILERILRRLAQAVLNESDLKDLRKGDGAGLNDPSLTHKHVCDMLFALTGSLHRVAISTIDSLFSRMASVFRHELQLPANAIMVDSSSPRLQQLRYRAIEAMLGDDDVDVLVGLLRRLHHDNAARSVSTAIDRIVQAMYDTYRRSEAFHWDQLKVPHAPRADMVKLAFQALEDAIEHAPHKSFAKGVRDNLDAAMKGDWQTFFDKGIAKKLTGDGPYVFYKVPIDDTLISHYRTLFSMATRDMLEELSQATLASYDLLHRFHGHYDALRFRHRLLTFSDMPYLLAHHLPKIDQENEQKALSKDPAAATTSNQPARESLQMELYYRLDSAIEHLLLDEFQDTNDDQWTVLRPIAEEITAGRDGSRSFFCVGDVKQAIYGWRGARAEIFDQIENELHLDDDASQPMTDSWRSSKFVLDAVNRVFGKLGSNPIMQTRAPFDELALKWQNKFQDHHAKRELPGYVELYVTPASEDDPPATSASDSQGYSSALSTNEDDGGDETDQQVEYAHETYIAAYISEIKASSPGASIGVLAPSNKQVARILHALRRQGIQASGEGSAAIVGDPAVDVILAALRLADHPGHTVAAYHVLNSPLGAIVGLRSADTRHCRDVAFQIRCDIFTKGLACVIATWAQQLAPACDTTNTRRLIQLMLLAEQFDPSLSLRLTEFVDHVENAAMEESSQDAVRVMTIHKAKGLEFDIVLLDGLNKTFGKVGMTALNELRDDETGELISIHRSANKTVRSLSPQLEEAYQYEEAKRFADDINSLYVAMTRPRHALHIMLKPLTQTKKGAPGTRGYSDNSFAALLRSALSELDNEPFEGDRQLFEIGDRDWYRQSTCDQHANTQDQTDQIDKPDKSDAAPSAKTEKRFSIEFKSASSAPNRTWRRITPSQASGMVSIDELLQSHATSGQRFGTIMHNWFSLIEWLDENDPQANIALTDQMLEQAAGDNLDHSPSNESKLSPLIVQFRKMLNYPQVQAVLTCPDSTCATDKSMQSKDTQASLTYDVWRERPFAVHGPKGLIKGTFDRVVITRKNTSQLHSDIAHVELIDYKTDSVNSDDATKTLTKKYTLQMATYVDALCNMLNIDRNKITVKLVLLSIGQVVPIEIS
jgi:ATP-dependent helicase/nuclease subunit A